MVSMSKNPCYHPILKRNQEDILKYFINCFKEVNGDTIKPVKLIPEKYLELVKENSELFFERILKSEKLRKLRRFMPHFDYATGKIFILENEYNLRTFIHELLHVFSVYYVYENINRYNQVYGIKFREGMWEGQTEFITGLLLYIHFKKCFQMFKYPPHYSPAHELLGYRYPEWARIWLSIASHFGYKYVTRSYFYGSVENITDVQHVFKEGRFYYLFQQGSKDLIHVKLEEKFDTHAPMFEERKVLNYSMLDDQLQKDKLL